jgi:hypothetical protein
MVMKNKGVVVAGLVVAAGLTAAAQQRLEFRDDIVGATAQAGFGVIAVDPVDMGAVVLDAPFSADAVTEVTQVLADGNRIEQRTSASMARSSEGQTRREQSGIALGTLMAPSAQPMVTISDPKTGVHLTLNYEQKIAYRMKPGRMRFTAASPADPTVTYGAAGVMASRGEVTMTAPAWEAARRVGPPPPPPGGTFEVAVDGPMRTIPDGGGPPMGGFGPPPVGFGPPMLTTNMASATFQWDGNVRTEKLEAKEIEGVRAEGTRTVMTIPAGSMGNVQPIEIVNERWLSPELQVVLLTRRYDPRFGETVYRLTNIVRGEPSADLFKVPADFKTEDVR